VFAFGFGTRIKTILPLINHLINEALLVADDVSVRCYFSSSTSLTGFWQCWNYKEVNGKAAMASN